MNESWCLWFASAVASRWEMYEDASAIARLGAQGLLHFGVMDEDVDLPVLLKKLQKVLIGGCLIPVTVCVSRSCIEWHYVHSNKLTTADNLKFHRLQQHTG